MNKYIKISIFVVTCLVVGYFSGQTTRESITVWYPTLVKPFFNPPNWIFAPVWSSLYLLIGIAAGLVWNRIDFEKEAVKKGLSLFAVQLGLNALWSYLFFGLHNPMLAFFEIIVLWLFIFETIKAFQIVDKVAAKLLYPYLAWVSFATILNGSIWFLNR
jgi:translocator protein